jgi:hypothetical protein
MHSTLTSTREPYIFEPHNIRDTNQLAKQWPVGLTIDPSSYMGQSAQ